MNKRLCVDGLLAAAALPRGLPACRPWAPCAPGLGPLLRGLLPSAARLALGPAGGRGDRKGNLLAGAPAAWRRSTLRLLGGVPVVGILAPLAVGLQSILDPILLG